MTAPRSLHPIQLRRWALDYSPARLRRMALDRVETTVSVLRPIASPIALRFWKKVVLGAEERLDRSHKKCWHDIFIRDKTSLRDFIILVAIFNKLSESGEPVIVWDRAPYAVPVDHVHLFDLKPAEVREGLAEALEKVRLEGIPEVAQRVVVDGATLSDSNWAKAWRFLDLLVAFHLRFFEGSAIRDQTVQFWIERNAWLVRHAVDPKMREAAQQSLDTIFQALLPPEYCKRTPDEVGLSSEYWEIRRIADPVLKRRNLRDLVKGEDLCRRFPEDDSHLINRLAGCTSQKFALGLLSGTHRLKPGYLLNLIKRGNLLSEISAHWRETLWSIDKAEFVPPSNPQ